MKTFAGLVLIGVLCAVSSNPINVANPDEQSGKWQGDIMLSLADLGRNGVIAASRRWPNGVIPYTIEGHTSAYITNILAAMAHISSRTCITFKARTTETDYVKITNGATGCWSYVGRTGGAQTLNVQSSGGCASVGVTAHELLHAIGFHHAQSSTDRDLYVTINLDNVISGQEHNFNKYAADYVSDYGEGYDYGSILHYSAYSFSKNGKTTIDPKQAGVTIGQRSALSTKDANKVNKMYAGICSSTTTTTTTTTRTTTTTTTPSTTLSWNKLP